MWPKHNLALNTSIRLLGTYYWRVLVNSAVVAENSVDFNLVCWLMVIRKPYHCAATICRKTSATIPCVSNIAHVIYNKSNNCTAAAPINIANFYLLSLSEFQKKFLCLLETFTNSLNRILREINIFYIELMQIISKEISADMTSVSIIDAEEGALWPIFIWKLFAFWLHNVKNDCQSVFFVVSDDSLIRVGSVGCKYTITFGTVFCWLIVWHQHLDVLISTISNLFSNISEKILALNIQVALKHRRFFNFWIGWA